MYPDNNPNPAPIDYLNQIAPEPKKPGINKQTLILVIVGIGLILALVIGFVMFASSSATGPKAATQTLTARLQEMQVVATKAQKNIKSSDLRGINSNLVIFLTDANRDIETPLTVAGIDSKKLDKTIVAKEKADPITADLEDARLNAVYDDTYAREMSYKLKTISLLIQQIYDQTNSNSMKEFLVDTDDSLQPIKQQLDDFNSTAR